MKKSLIIGILLGLFALAGFSQINTSTVQKVPKTSIAYDVTWESHSGLQAADSLSSTLDTVWTFSFIKRTRTAV